jgi:hypothetical protein
MAVKTKRGKVSNSHSVKSYKTYRFINKDPIIDKLRTLKLDTGMSAMDIERASGLKSGTQNNWFKGGTRRPQHASVAAFVGACGYEFKITKKKHKS